MADEVNGGAVVRADYRLRVLPLAAGTFAIGTGLLVVQGILPEMARDLGVSVGAAGQLVTAFAVAYAVSAPFLSAVAAKFDQKRLLIGALIVFALSNVGAALAPSLAPLIVARVVAALSSALFTPNASAAGASLAPPNERGRALALVFGGLSVATVLGVPIGTLIGGAAGWRATFLFVGALGALAAAGLAILLPRVARPPAISGRALLEVVRRPRVISAAAITTLTMTGAFVVFAYIAPLVERITGGEGAVAAALFVFGIAAVAGNALGGIATDYAGPRRTLIVGLATFALALAALWVLSGLAPTITTVVAATAALILWGIANWAFNPPQQQRLLEAAPDAGGLALSVNASALYVGIALGSAIGGYTLGLGQLENLGLIGAVFVAAALGLLLLTGERPGGAVTAAPAPRRADKGPPADCVAPCGPLPGTGPAKVGGR